MTELRSAIYLNNENMHAARSEGGRETLRESVRGQSQLQQEKRELVSLCLQEQTSENACDAVLSACESRGSLSPRTQPVPGANLRQDLFQQNCPERTLAERSVDGPEM